MNIPPRARESLFTSETTGIVRAKRPVGLRRHHINFSRKDSKETKKCLHRDVDDDDTIRYDTIRYDTIRYDTIRSYDTMRYEYCVQFDAFSLVNARG
jgi:hypothetical protein